MQQNQGRIALWIVCASVAALVSIWLSTSLRQAPSSTGQAIAAAGSVPPAGLREDIDAPNPATSGAEETRSSAASNSIAAPAVDEERIELHILTRVALMPTSQVVPRIRVEVGYGPSFHEGSSVLGTGTTDETGSATIAVPKRALGDVASIGGARYWARVVEPGYQRRTGGSSRAPGSDPTRIVVIAFPGNTLVGRVVDEAGQPVKASVSSRYWHANGKLVRDAGGESDSNGSFVLHCNQSARVTLLADAGRKGVGVLADVGLPRTEGCDPLTIVVHGPGVVRGQVKDATGKPAAGLELLVLVAELDDADGSFILPEPRATAIEVEGRGRSWETITTGVDGSFESIGLRDDLYVVRARSGESSGYPILLSRAPLQADGTALHLTLNRRPHILVQVVDETGAPWKNTLICDRAWFYRSSAEAFDKPRLVVSVARDAAHALDRDAYAVSGQALSDSKYAFNLTTPGKYTVALRGGNMGFAAQNVTVSETDGQVDVVLVGAERSKLGTIVVDPRLPDGAVPRGAVAMRLEDPTTGFPIAEQNTDRVEAMKQSFTVPAGTYTLVVDGRAQIDSYHGVVFSRRNTGHAEATVVVRAGERDTIEPVLGLGARLRVVLEGKLDNADRGALEKGHSVWNLDEWASLVQLQLVAPQKWPIPVEFIWVIEGSSAAGAHERSELAFGSDQVSELLPSGDFVLEARTRGERVVTTPVILSDGQTTDVIVHFPSVR